MADLGTNSALMSDEERRRLAQQQGGAVDLGGTQSGTVNGQGGVSTAGIGAGGQGMWTNIQAYLGANKQDTGSADYLKNQVESQFDKEKGDLEKSASEAKTQAQSQADQINQAKDNSKTWVNQAAQGYDWEGNNKPEYYDNTKKLTDAITNQYSGPTGYNYAFSDPTQKFQQNLKNEDSFWNHMKDTYKQRSGGQMSSGVAELQRQFDTTNDPLQAQRQNLLQKYIDMQTLRDTTQGEANSAIEKARQDYGNNQENLKNNLFGLANNYQSDIDQNQANANNDFYNVRQEGFTPNYYGFGPSYGVGENPNFTPEKIQQWLDANANARAASGEGSPAAQYYDNLKNKVGEFFTGQESKYLPKDEEYKKNWNTIQDILKTTSDRKKKDGFSVRG